MPLATTATGAEATQYLVFDGNDHGALRLTVEHATPDVPQESNASPPHAVFWVRIGSGLDGTRTFDARCDAFTKAQAFIDDGREAFRAHVEGVDGPVFVSFKTRHYRPDKLIPEPTTSVLELDGKDLGAEILAHLPE